MKLDPNIQLSQLVSCEECYAIFSPDNILEGVEAKKHICPKCEWTKEQIKSLYDKINKEMDRKFKHWRREILIEVTRIIDVRLERQEDKQGD